MGERLTAILTSLGHLAAVAHACRIAHSPSGTMKPISSATGMKALGGMMPFSGWRQRSRASTPLISLVSRLTTG